MKWRSLPTVDLPVTHLNRKTTRPFEGILTFKDSTDQHLESLFKISFICGPCPSTDSGCKLFLPSYGRIVKIYQKKSLFCSSGSFYDGACGTGALCFSCDGLLEVAARLSLLSWPDIYTNTQNIQVKVLGCGHCIHGVSHPL